MKSATIIIAIIFLLPASQQSSEGMPARKVLSYNPTYDFWFFMPKGRPDSVPQSVKDVYWKTRSVCYTHLWFHCESGEKIAV